jgi:uncharacterized protein YjbJ (UPF0337 family)
MNALTLVRTAVSGSIKVARLPLDLANGLLGRHGLEVDAADARVRESVGRAVGDQELRKDGARRRAATKQRERASTLRADADRREKTATRTARDAAGKLDELEDRERLEQLENEAEALDKRSAAQTAADESQRLEAAAERVKETRKDRVS